MRRFNFNNFKKNNSAIEPEKIEKSLYAATALIAQSFPDMKPQPPG